MKKKLIAACAAMALMGTVLVGGTLAWLTDNATVTNTFTVGKVDITLTEEGWNVSGEDPINPTATKKIIPGQTLTKEPVVTVLAGSEKSYVFASYTNPAPEILVVNPMTEPKWELAEGYTNLYVYTNGTGEAVAVLPEGNEDFVMPALFASVTAAGEDWDGSIPDNVTAEEFKIEVKAFAIQADSIEYNDALKKAEAQLLN